MAIDQRIDAKESLIEGASWGAGIAIGGALAGIALARLLRIPPTAIRRNPHRRRRRRR